MTASRLDRIREATRLTRTGRLTDALDMLGEALSPGGPAPQPAAPPSRPYGPKAKGLGGLSDVLKRAAPAFTMPSGLAETLPSSAPVNVPPGARFEIGQFTAPAGLRPYRLYTPSRPAEQPALVVMLHGCKQNPEDFAAGTRMNELAERHGFLVLYPGQVQSANISRCWNWFETTHQQREGGEPSIVAGMVREIATGRSVDSTRVYVAGLSAGGAAAAALALLYPDVFAAVGVHSGLACGVAHDVQSAFQVMRDGTPAPVPGVIGRPIPAIVFHGDRDRTVNPRNAESVITQLRGATKTRGTVEHGEQGDLGYTRALTWVGGETEPTLERWTVHGAGHAWSGGSPAGSYTDARGPDATAEMVRFFLAHPRRS